MNHNDRIRLQFGLRAPTFNRSAHWITHPALIEAHLKAAGKPPGEVLALCCGTGITGRALSEAGWDVTGVDVTAEMVRESGRHFKAVQASVDALPFESRSFDLCVMRQAYFLLGDGPAALREARRVLRPGGRFILSQTVPYSEVDEPWLRKVHETKQKEMTRFFTAGDLEAELNSHGFRVVKKDSITIRESVSLWMANAPEMEPERREKVCELVASAPEEYRRLREVEVRDGEILENWNWVILTAEVA